MSPQQRNITITAVILLAIILLCWGTFALGSNLVNQFLNPESPTPVPTVDAFPGLFILDVFPDSPGAQAGLQAGQIILEVEDVTMNTPLDLQGLLSTKQSGDAINMVLLVDGERRQIEVFRGIDPPYLGIEIIENWPGAATPLETPTHGEDVKRAETAVPATLDSAHLGLAVIAAVLPDTPAAEAELAVGDVITAVDDHAILTGDELIQAIHEKAVGDTILLTIRRGPDTLTHRIILTSHPDDANRAFLGIELQTP